MIMFTGLLALEYHNLDMKSRKVCNKTRSPPASLLFKDQSTEHTTVKWPLHRIESSLIWYNTPLNYWKPYIHRTWICPNTKFFEPVDHVRGSTGGLKPKILRYSSNAEVIEDSWPVHVGDVDQYSRWCCCLGVLNRVIDTGGGSEAICCCSEPLHAFSQGFFPYITDQQQLQDCWWRWSRPWGNQFWWDFRGRDVVVFQRIQRCVEVNVLLNLTVCSVSMNSTVWLIQCFDEVRFR